MGKYEVYLDEKVLEQSTDLVAEIHDFEEHGSVIIGKLLKIGKYHSEKYNKDQNEYIFDTDDGLKKVVLNDNADKCFTDPDYVGRIIYIKFEGRIKLNSGKEFKKFTIKLIRTSEEAK
jgi:hypothetical protein